MSSEAVRRRLADRFVNLGDIRAVVEFVGETREVKAALRSFRLRAAIRRIPLLGSVVRRVYRIIKRATRP